jgi:DNA-binding IclR family transcriptional regulator
VAELANELQLPRATVYGILRTLRKVGFVEQDRDSRKYQVGPALLHLGSMYIEGSELRLRALRWADALASQAQQSVCIGTLHENLVLIVHHVLRPDDTPQSLAVGRLMPLHATALGKALLVNRREVARELAAHGLRSYTDTTVTDPARLDAQLDGIEKCGWAHDIGEFVPGIASIAAGIESRDRTVLGAIAISGPLDRICSDRSPRSELAGHVMESAFRISRELGGGPW